MREPSVPKRPEGVGKMYLIAWEQAQIARLLRVGMSREWIAGALGMSMSTLVRRLRDAGGIMWSYKQPKPKPRRARAQR